MTWLYLVLKLDDIRGALSTVFGISIAVAVMFLVLVFMFAHIESRKVGWKTCAIAAILFLVSAVTGLTWLALPSTSQAAQLMMYKQAMEQRHRGLPSSFINNGASVGKEVGK